MTAAAKSNGRAASSNGNGKRRSGRPPLPAEPETAEVSTAPPPDGEPPRDPVAEVLEAWRAGLSAVRVRERLCRERGLGEAEARAAVEQARALLRQTLEAESPADRLARAVEQRESIAARALAGEKPDMRIALSALESRDKLLGLGESDVLADDKQARTLLELAEAALRLRNQTDDSGASR